MSEIRRQDDIGDLNLEEKESKVVSVFPEKERKLLESLDRKVEIAGGFKDLVDSISLNEEPEDVSDKMHRYFDEVKSGFSSDILKLAKDYRLLEKKYEKIEKDLVKGKLNEDTVSDMFEMRDRVNKILRNNDTVFLIEMENAIKNLEEKNEYIYDNKEDEDELVLEGLVNGYGKSFHKDRVVNVTIEPFDVIYTIDKKTFHGDYPNYTAFHKVNSPFIFIHDGIKGHDRDVVVRHEKVHNVLDKLTKHFPGNFNSEDFRYNIEKYEGDSIDPDISKDIKDRSFKRILNIKSSTIINSLHEEIVASLEHAHQRGFSEIHRSSDEIVSMALRNERDLRI